jgi:branched-subunit amino acid transport protein
MAGLTAILVPDIVLNEAGALTASFDNLKLWAVGIALLVWFRWQSTVAALLASGSFYVALHLV